MSKKQVTLYQKTRTNKIQLWSIWVEPHGKSNYPEVWVKYGHIDGKKQLTHEIVDKGVNEGKANETTPLQQAHLVMERKVRKQKEYGYVEDLESLDVKNYIDFDKRLPKNLCFYKPKNSITDKKIKELETNRRAIYTIKRDGMMHIVRTSEKFGVEIYSRRMDLVTDKYPHLVKELEKLPPGMIFLGEIIINQDGRDNFNAVSQICRSDPDKAIAKQEQMGYVSYYIFDMAYFYNDNALVKYPYEQRLHKINLFIDQYNLNKNYIIPAERVSKNHHKALEYVQNRNMEGLVVWDAYNRMKDDEAFTFRGKAYRPSVLWKSKPSFENDFIVKFSPKDGIGYYGKGKHHNKVGSVFLYQLDENNQEIFLGKCGGGLTDEQREYYTKAQYPRVWRIEYDSVQPKTGKLRYPEFSADRTTNEDKEIKECTLGEDIKKARKED